MLGGLDDGVLLRVQSSAEFVAFAGRNLETLPQAAGCFAVSNPGRNAIITCCKYVAILDQ
jgi:hypothetical protein